MRGKLENNSNRKIANKPNIATLRETRSLLKATRAIRLQQYKLAVQVSNVLNYMSELEEKELDMMISTTSKKEVLKRR